MTLGTEQHVALPTLIGAPAYSRPPRPVQPTPRPVDPDDLPIEAEMTDDERRLLASAGWSSVAQAMHLGVQPGESAQTGTRMVPEAQPFTVHSVADRILSGR